MRLQTIRYAEHPSTPQEWGYDELPLGAINLIAGKNASGKTRILNSIGNLGLLLAGQIPRSRLAAVCRATFATEANTYSFSLSFRDGNVSSETLEINGKPMLQRDETGTGTIWAEKLGQMLDFEIPATELITARRDAIQHSFLQPLHSWGDSVRLYRFSGRFGKGEGIIPPNEELSPIPPAVLRQDTHRAFRDAMRKNATRFQEVMLADMLRLGYPLRDLRLAPSDHVKIDGPHEFQVLIAEEEGLAAPIEQIGMSLGMYRALALLIHVNRGLLFDFPSCLIIDDIGEGLDFERAVALVDLLIEKANQATETGLPLQLVLSTNDRHVMNRIPLDHWSLIHRQGGHCRIYSKTHDEKLFKRFRFTGLSNFDLLATDFINVVEKEQSPEPALP